MNKYPRVTEILSPYYDFSQVSEGTLLGAQYRGTVVHRCCLTMAKGLFVPKCEYDGYFRSFVRWLKECVKTVIAVEPELISESLGFMGHPDLIVEMRGDDFLSLPDLKTPQQKQRLWEAQVAAYTILAEQNNYVPIGKAGSLRLDKNGGVAKFDICQNLIGAKVAFQAQLIAYKYFVR